MAFRFKQVIYGFLTVFDQAVNLRGGSGGAASSSGREHEDRPGQDQLGLHETIVPRFPSRSRRRGRRNPWLPGVSEEPCRSRCSLEDWMRSWRPERRRAGILRPNAAEGARIGRRRNRGALSWRFSRLTTLFTLRPGWAGGPAILNGRGRPSKNGRGSSSKRGLGRNGRGFSSNDGRGFSSKRSIPTVILE